MRGRKNRVPMCVQLTTGTRLARRAARSIAALCAAVALLPLSMSGAHAEPAPADAVADLKFAQFFKSPIGPAGLELSDQLRAVDGRPVRLVGYMVAQEQARPGRFWLTPRPVRMSEHADGEADDLPAATVTVLLDPAQRDRLVAHRNGLVTLTGTLSIGRVEDETGRVSWIRLQLPTDALSDSPDSSSQR